MQIIRRNINDFRQWRNDLNGYIPRGRNPVEAELKLSCYRSLIQCTTLIFKSWIFVFILDATTKRKGIFSYFFELYNFGKEVSVVDLYFILLKELYDVLFSVAFYKPISTRRYNNVSFYAVLVMLAKFLGNLIECGWYLMNCGCGDWFYFRLFAVFVLIYLIYKSVITICNSVHAYLQLKEHQQILDSLPKFKFNSVASKGG